MTRLTAVTGVLAISFSAILVALADASPNTVAFFRAAYAIPALTLAWLASRGRDDRPLPSRALAFGAGLLLAIDLAMWHVSIDKIGAGLATVLANTQVAFVGLIAWAIYRERPTRAALIVVPVVFGGVVLLSGLGRDDAFGDEPVGGVLFGVAAGFAYAGFILTLRASNRRHLVPSPGPLLDATAGTALGAFVIGTAAGDLALAPSWPSHGWLVALALLVQVFGWLLITVALPRLPALETSVMILIQPVGAIVWAYLIFTETLSVIQWIGVVMVLGGVVVLSGRGIVEPARRVRPGRHRTASAPTPVGD